MKLVLSAIAAIGALALLAGLGNGRPNVQAAQFTIQGTASGAEEVPVVTRVETVSVRFVFDDQTNVLTYAATVSGLSPVLVTAAHIHRAARGANGPIIHNLSLTGFTQIAGSLLLTAADVADLRAGNLYFNAHSKEHPGGFARFQLTLPAAAAPAATPAAPAVRAPSTGDGGLAGVPTLSPIVGLLALALGGAGVFALARRRA